MSTVFGAGPEFVSRVEATMVWWWNSTSETPYDALMKTAKVQLTFKAGILGTESGNKMRKKKLYFIENSNLYFQKNLLGGGGGGGSWTVSFSLLPPFWMEVNSFEQIHSFKSWPLWQGIGICVQLCINLNWRQRKHCYIITIHQEIIKLHK